MVDKGSKIAEKGDAGILARIWREHTRKYVWTLLGVLVITSLIAGAEAYSVSLIKPVFDQGLITGNSRLLVVLCAQIVALYFSKGWLYYAQTRIMSHISTRTVQRLQHRVFSHLISLDVGFFSRTPSGQMLARVTGDTGAISGIAISFITTVFKDVVTCVSMFSLMIFYSWRMCLVACLFVPIGAFFVKRIGVRVKSINRAATQRGADYIAKISESLQNIRLIKSYGMEKYEERYISGLLNDMFRLGMDGVRNSASVTPVIESLAGLVMAGIIVFGGWQISEGALTTGGFATFLGAWVSSYKPLKSLINFRVSLQQALVSAERVYEIIDTKPGISDAKGATGLKGVCGDIEFRKVGFAYDGGRRVLSDISFSVPRGRTIALVGPSGAGKSTVINLIPRFFDPSEGAVLVDGVDIRGVTQESLRASIALVTQDVMLFDDTIRNNIAYGRGEGAVRDVGMDDIVAAAKNAYADEFIRGLADGYDTRVGERGVNLSGGQKQRISIARALVKDAPILLLDEATSALDAESEHEVQKALENLMKDRTTVVIAHRLSTIIGADVIYVMDAGRIVESGTHAELLAAGGEYARLYGMQFKAGK